MIIIQFAVSMYLECFCPAKLVSRSFSVIIIELKQEESYRQ